MPTSYTTINRDTTTAALTYEAGATNRRILYTQNLITFSPVGPGVTMPVADFEWLVTESELFADLIQTHMRPDAQRDGVFGIDFEIGPKVGPEWTTGFRVRFNNINPPPGEPVGVSFDISPAGAGTVTFGERPMLSVIWPNYLLMNRLSREMLFAYRFGYRPPLHTTLHTDVKGGSLSWPVNH